MKRILQLTFCTFSHQCLLLLVCLMCALPSWADKTSGNVTYKIEGDNAVVTGLADAALKAITIPGEIEGHKVVIGNRAFSWCANLTSVTMSKGVTRIGYEAFYNCSSLTTITIPEGVTNIGDGAFWLCSNLESVTIPEGVTTLGYKAFANCSNLATITIPEGVTTIGDEAFSGCSKLTSISLPSTIQNLTGKTFANWYGTLNVTSNDLSFENGALFNSNKQKLIAYCSNSNNYTIPTSVTSIGKGAFYGCINLNTLTISENVTDIDTEAFSNCINLTTVAIPASVTRIGEGAFSGCTALTEVTCKATVVPNSTNSFSEDGTMPSEVKLYVPAESLDAYKTSPTWNIFNEIESLSYIAINISAAQKTTYCSDQALDFTNTTGVKAYIASGFSPSTGIVLLTRVKKVPAGVGFMLIGSEGKYDIPFCETDFSYANLFVGTVSETTVSGTAAGKNNYVLGNGNEGVKFYLANNTVVPAHKAYLSIPAAIMGAPAKTISFAFEDDDTTTGIITVNDMMKITNIKVYGIDGRLKNGISSGINIVNGKKIYVK